MIKLIVGNKGSGKTKKLVDGVNAAVAKDHGAVVCVEKGLPDAAGMEGDGGGRRAHFGQCFQD